MNSRLKHQFNAIGYVLISAAFIILGVVVLDVVPKNGLVDVRFDVGKVLVGCVPARNGMVGIQLSANAKNYFLKSKFNGRCENNWLTKALMDSDEPIEILVDGTDVYQIASAGQIFVAYEEQVESLRWAGSSFILCGGIMLLLGFKAWYRIESVNSVQ